MSWPVGRFCLPPGRLIVEKSKNTIRQIADTQAFIQHALRYAGVVVKVPRLILLLFLVAQLCDGIFTYVAVSAVGIAAEGNALLAVWMGLVGPGATLFAAKSIAAGAGLLVYYRGLHGLLAGLTAFYAAAAVGPWLAVYATWP
jgi:hypothetical protein